MMFAPPYDPKGADGEPCAYPVCFINGNLELPAPHVVWPEDYSNAEPDHLRAQHHLHDDHPVGRDDRDAAHARPDGARTRDDPGQGAERHRVRVGDPRGSSRCRSAGPAAKPYIPLFAGFFIFILFCNWSGLLPFIGKVEFRAGPDQRREHHDRPRARRLRLLRVPGLQGARRRRVPVQVLPVRRVPQGGRRRDHRGVRGPDRAPPGVRQARHAVDATLRQHLRRRGGARRCSPRSPSRSSRWR